MTKFRDKSEAAGTLGYGGNDWIILRYADVELMLAEVNEALDNADAAIRYWMKYVLGQGCLIMKRQKQSCLQ